MRRILFATAALLLGATAVQADPTALYISEVLEAAPANRKYIEIYNPSLTSVDLAASTVVLRRYSNDSVTPSTTNITLTGTIAAGGFFVVANNATDHDADFPAALANQYDTGISHNGNDKYDLYNVTGDSVIDTFAGDNIGNAGSFAVNVVAYRIASALPNDGDWGDAVQPGNGADSASGFWRVFTTSDEATTAAEGTPGSSRSGLEAPAAPAASNAEAWELYY